ncbi:DUF3618 domain-containing protein [Streptomyces sp. SID13726]|uniref:DUF3618 domain-containing protein n=1 Tax=Streptomyces sp. SID13726 TaxID=2706058 RepID=UPI0013BB6154|nr:DUF3618 domain-containing protein [Streptomyces sp. SID13726]NEB01435.1 DUF3618 domain-containing protein [Streptomyces sp. SID13726]
MTDRTSGDHAPAGAEGPEELRRQIERTRSELGDTVEELAGKMDVKGRARARAADLRDKAGAMTVQLRSTAAQAGHTVHDRATQAGHKVHDTATRTGHRVHDRTLRAGHLTQDKAAETGHALERRAERSVPLPARPLVMAAVRHRRPVLIVGAAVAAVVVVSWRYPRK